PLTIGASARNRIVRPLLLHLTLSAGALVLLTLVRVRLVRTTLFVAHVALLQFRGDPRVVPKGAKGVPRGADTPWALVKRRPPNVGKRPGETSNFELQTSNFKPRTRRAASELCERAPRTARGNGVPASERVRGVCRGRSPLVKLRTSNF